MLQVLVILLDYVLIYLEQANLSDCSNEAHKKLVELYLISAHPEFPTKAVYKDPDGRFFELNDLRLRVWSAHMVSAHFLFHQILINHVPIVPR